MYILLYLYPTVMLNERFMFCIEYCPPSMLCSISEIVGGHRLPSYGIVQFWSRTDTSIVSDTVSDTRSDTGHWPKVSVSGFDTPTTDTLSSYGRLGRVVSSLPVALTPVPGAPQLMAPLSLCNVCRP